MHRFAIRARSIFSASIISTLLLLATAVAALADGGQGPIPK